VLGREYPEGAQLGLKETTMRLSQTDLFPVLAIVAGGLVGASLSFGLLGSGSDVPAPEPVVAPSEVLALGRVVTPPVTPELEMPKRIGIDRMVVLTGTRMKGNGMVLMGDRIEVHGDRMVLTGGRIEVGGMVLSGDRIEVENLQEEGWVVTSRPPLFRLPEIRQLPRER